MQTLASNAAARPDPLEALEGFVRRHPRLFVLTGAGCSTDSGIPDYRDADGQWKHRRPIQYRDFVGDEFQRRRYWARSLIGFRTIAEACPNPTHTALARLEAGGRVHQLVTQNVDGLHRRAGSRRVIDLHGTLDTLECLGCRSPWSRAAFQAVLEELNPGFGIRQAASVPDGDVDLESADFHAFQVPDCPRCGGLLKPSVVFFGESVPRERVELACRRLAEADALLVVGSSLMVFSGYRFCRAAREQGKPTAAINLGRTRADAELDLKVAASCGEILPALLRRLDA